MAVPQKGPTEWISRYLREDPPRSKSLTVSAFGDSIAPLTPGVWLGDLIKLLAPLGMNERLVRTSAFRLVEEGWLRARRDGRRSYYSVTDAGAERFELAYGRIYTAPQEQWDEKWTIVLLPKTNETGSERMDLRRELEWQGFASVAQGLMLHPSASRAELSQVLHRLGLQDKAVVLEGQTCEGFPSAPAQQLAERYWDLRSAGEKYHAFIERFDPLLSRVESGGIDPENAFVVQTLLIHSFRRAMLHDPRLPTSMLPPNWPGKDAFEITRQIYRRTFKASQHHLSSILQNVERSSRGIGEDVCSRFGGLC